MGNFNEWLKPELIWFLIGLIMLLLEFSLPGLIIFFFGVGAWIVALICLFVDISLNVQLGIFLVLSIISLVSFRKWMRRIFVGQASLQKREFESAREYVGEKAVVTRKIAPRVAGKVEFHGTSWSAEADEEIEAGTPVEIVEKNNITFKVKALQGG